MINRDTREAFFEVDINEEVTERIKKDSNYYYCLKKYPMTYIGKIATFTVSVTDGKPFMLRSSDRDYNSIDSISGSIYITPLFTEEELSILSGLARKTRKINIQYLNQNQ